ncbi:MAG: hypothetical protein ACE149_09220 [Armatimonadota bacterium]
MVPRADVEAASLSSRLTGAQVLDGFSLVGVELLDAEAGDRLLHGAGQRRVHLPVHRLPRRYLLDMDDLPQVTRARGDLIEQFPEVHSTCLRRGGRL